LIILRAYIVYPFRNGFLKILKALNLERALKFPCDPGTRCTEK
jgi:hypothetical protein